MDIHVNPFSYMYHKILVPVCSKNIRDKIVKYVTHIYILPRHKRSDQHREVEAKKEEADNTDKF